MLPVASTSIDVQRQSPAVPSADPDMETDYGPGATWVTVFTGLRANINAGQGNLSYGPAGEQEVVLFRFQTDLPPENAAILGDDRVIDNMTGQVFVVRWARQRRAMQGLSHIEGELAQVVGVP